MKVLLIRPDPGNERFGLGPFFRVEPLGLEYVAAALSLRGCQPIIIDERLHHGGVSRMLAEHPRLVGISCMHALEYDQVLRLARAIRRAAPDVFIIVGGHAAAAYPAPLETPEVDAVCLCEGEVVMPALVDALAGRQPVPDVPGLRIRTPDGWISTPSLTDRPDLQSVPLPARGLLERYRRSYHCLLFRPVWLVETARGCPYRCTFCSVWQLYQRSFREHPISSVVEDLTAVGENVFIADDLFWNHRGRSLELALALRKRQVRKRWLLVQTRTDLVCRNPALLSAWRPLAQDFDIFFGLEAASNTGLDRLSKDATINDTVEAARIARSMGYGVTGNFVVDPDWGEQEFEQLWDFVATHRLQRAGYTILTPLPGTELYEKMRQTLRGQPWYKYDMHHLLWEPRLGAERFFELYAETWRRSILNLRGPKRWHDWAKQVRFREIPYLTRVLLRSQRMMQASAYLQEHSV